MAAFHTACASFVSRNWGAGNRKRMMKSYLVSLSYSFISGAVLGGLLLAFGRQFLSFFVNEPEVITAGMERIKIMGCSYTISAFMDCTIAASRGIGKSIAPTITVILGSYVFRAVWVNTVFAHFKRSARSICCTAFHGRLPRRLRSSISSEAATRCQSRMRRRHKSGAKAGTGCAYAHEHFSKGGGINVTAVFLPERHGR